MISSLIESFKQELQKEETQQYIIDFIDPFLNKYKFYFYIIVILLIIVAGSTSFSAYLLFKNQK